MLIAYSTCMTSVVILIMNSMLGACFCECSQTCLSDHLYIVTTCTSDHLFSTPLRFPYIIYLYIETTCLTRTATKRFPTKTVARPALFRSDRRRCELEWHLVTTQRPPIDCSLDWVHKHLCATLTDHFLDISFHHRLFSFKWRTETLLNNFLT
jgi:hypothetical protein